MGSKRLCVFIKFLSNNNKIIITIFVDDLIIAYNKEAEKEWLSVNSWSINVFVSIDKTGYIIYC